MPFINLTNIDGLPLSLNTEQVLYVEPNGSRAKINFANGGHLRVQDTYEDVRAQLPILLASINEQLPTPEQLAAEEAARKAAEQAELERQADEARKNKGNPAKTRETK